MRTVLAVSYESVKLFMAGLKEKEPTRVFRLESLPGEEMQVDFGQGLPIIRRLPHHAEIIAINGRSLRLEQSVKQRTPSKDKTNELFRSSQIPAGAGTPHLGSGNHGSPNPS